MSADVAASRAAPRTVAVLPARGGSKRIPRKNIRSMSGKPLLWWSIQTCLASNVFDDIIVSTDDDEVAAVALDAGASVPFTRPESLADDFTPTADVIAHAVGWLAEARQPTEVACCVYPASIFVTPEDLARSARLLRHGRYVATVVRYPHPIQRALTMGSDGRLAFEAPQYAAARTQDLPVRWHDAGQFYWGAASAWLERLPILANAVGYPVDSRTVCDIDTEDDWLLAEQLHRLERGLG